MKYKSTVDMISFITKMTDNDFYKYNSYLQLNPNCNMWIGTSFKQYRYNYSVRGVGSYYIGFQHNSESYEYGSHSLKIEYNPNKVEFDDLLKKLLCFCFSCSETRVKSIDVAFDLEIPFENYVIDRGMKHNVDVFKGTLYIGNREDGVKIYDKQKESRLERPLTRYEIRIPLNINLKYILRISSYECDNLPVITFVSTLPIDGFDRVVLLGLMQDVNALSTFSRRRKEKYREFLKQFIQFTPKPKEILQCIQNYIKSLKTCIELV